MRKYYGEKILGLLGILAEAHIELKRQTETDVVFGLLIDCQKLAVQILRYIVAFSGENVALAALINEYCELVFKKSQGEEISVNQLEEKVQDIVNKVKESMKNPRKEIVFFPYQLSMWDSMESVYLAAKDDPDCDVYVVPIPWFERNPDGIVNKANYDGELYPKNIKITDWRKYDVQERCPDVIFIHNPYDDGNFITTVHPDFYSKRLREFTNLLCYIPYFVTNDNLGEHFCTASGCVYSHKIFVQSDKMRDSYINAYRKAYGNNYGVPEDKFVALGSPKFDKVINDNPENYTLPKNWYNLIYCADGTKKKVILYNTSVGIMLQFNDIYLKKLRFVFDIFKERDDVVLWWRPHPLAETTYASMRPHLLSEYRQIVDDYKREAFGIYDDSPDMHTSFVFSDAYFGDGSSLVLLYQLTGKPIMYQNVRNSEYDRIFNFEQTYDDGKYLWFSAQNFNGLFKMSKETYIPEFIGCFPDEEEFGERLYFGIAESNGKLYFSPLSAKEIAVYDINSNTFEKIKIKEIKDKKYETLKLYSIAAYNDKVAFIPWAYDSIVLLDTNTSEIKYIDCNVKRGINGELFGTCSVMGSKVVLPCLGENKVVILDTLTGKTKTRAFGDKNSSFYSAYFDGKYLWLCRYIGGDAIIRVDLNTGNYISITLPDGVNADGNAPFSGFLYANGTIWVTSWTCDYVIKIDRETGNARIDECFSKMNYRYPINISENKFYTFFYSQGILEEYDVVTEVLNEIKIPFPDNPTAEASLLPMNFNKLKKEIFGEWGKTLGDFMEYILQMSDTDGYKQDSKVRADKQKKMFNNPAGTAGRKIYDYV